MKTIFDNRAWAVGGDCKFGCGDCHHARVILVELLVVLTITHECSGLLKGSQMNKPMGLGFVEGGVFRITGLTVEEQDE